MQYVLTEQELEAIRGNPTAELQKRIAEHKEEIQQAHKKYANETMVVIRRYVSPDQMADMEKELRPAIMELAKAWLPAYT